MIRKVTVEDAQAIADIYNEYVRKSVVTFEIEPVTLQEMRQRIDELSAGYPYWVYEDDGRVLGYCYAHQWKERAASGYTWETAVYVDVSARGKGIGRALVSHLIEECRRAGVHVLVACIVSENEGSIRLHRRLGFKQVSHFYQVGRKFGRWLDILDFQLLLQEDTQDDECHVEDSCADIR
ncbi:MAG: GNAT family N-acetyltransferase [Bacteroidaceae bacterium]|nr:GNAT family N-acetyltransferase [Bacteroidaceae bacterium]